jgi:hypothetical protein
MAATSTLGSWPCPIGLAKDPESASEAGVMPPLPGGIPGVGPQHEC